MALAEQAEAAVAVRAYDPILDVYYTLYPPSTPVTPERTDRGMSRYIAAHEYFDETGH